MHQLVLLRHGESEWNRDNRFTGWTDIHSTPKGEAQRAEAGHLLRKHGFTFDVTFTSVLKRAIRTLWIVLDETDQMWLPIHCCWELNERHYGALQGLNKKRAGEQYGKEQVQAWRRSYDTFPPPLPHFIRGIIRPIDATGTCVRTKYLLARASETQPIGFGHAGSI